MSLSVNASQAANPFAYLQALQQQSPGNTQQPADPLSALLAAINQSGNTATSPSAAGTSGGGTAPANIASPQFGSQTLQTLLALQSNGGNSQSPQSQLNDALTGSDPEAGQQSQQTQGHHGHHHHHHVQGAGLDSSQDPTSGDASSSAASNSMGANNLMEQLLQMQSQLNPAVTQSLATV